MIRTLRASDLGAYRALWLRAVTDRPPAFSTTFDAEKDASLEEIAAERGVPASAEHYTLGYFEPDLRAFATWRRDQRIIARHKAYLTAFYVGSSARGRGVGKSMLQEIVHRSAQTRGLRQIHLWVFHTSLAARSLYRNAGFEAFGRVPEDLWFGDRPVDAIYMIKML